MGKASSSSSSSAGIEQSGGNIGSNPTNYVAWIVGLAIAAIVAYAWLKGRK
jgi:hypothetical protein